MTRLTLMTGVAVALAACGGKTAPHETAIAEDETDQQPADAGPDPDLVSGVKTYDFSGDAISGWILQPDFPVADADATPYAKAWHLVAAGDLVGAQAALAEVVVIATTPVKKSKKKIKPAYPPVASLRREYATLSALVGVDHVTAAAAWTKAADAPLWLEVLADAYFESGELALCDAALAELQPLVAKDKAKLARLEETRSQVRLALEDLPGAADALLAAWDAAKDSPEPAQHDDVAAELGSVARILHNDYSRTLVSATGDAAQRLYAAYLAIPGRADQTDMQAYSDDLAYALAHPSSMVLGDLDKAGIRRRIKWHLAELLACYERPLHADHALHGTMTLSFRVLADGTTGDVNAAGFDPIAGCVTEHVAQWRFPASDLQIVVASYPFTFELAPDRSPPRRLQVLGGAMGDRTPDL